MHTQSALVRRFTPSGRSAFLQSLLFATWSKLAGQPEVHTFQVVTLGQPFWC
jgi:hypothetical protein